MNPRRGEKMWTSGVSGWVDGRERTPCLPACLPVEGEAGGKAEARLVHEWWRCWWGGVRSRLPLATSHPLSPAASLMPRRSLPHSPVLPLWRAGGFIVLTQWCFMPPRLYWFMPRWFFPCLLCNGVMLRLSCSSVALYCQVASVNQVFFNYVRVVSLWITWRSLL